MLLATFRPPTDCKHTCRGPVTLCPPSFTSFRRTYHHHHYRHHPTTNSSLSGQTQAIWNSKCVVHWGVKRVKCFGNCKGNTCHVHLGAVQSCEWLTEGLRAACYGEGGRLVNTAARHYGGQQAQQALLLTVPPTWETLEWVQRWRGQRSVEDDTEHGAGAEGWEPVRLWLREQSVTAERLKRSQKNKTNIVSDAFNGSLPLFDLTMSLLMLH